MNKHTKRPARPRPQPTPTPELVAQLRAEALVDAVTGNGRHASQARTAEEALLEALGVLPRATSPKE